MNGHEEELPLVHLGDLTVDEGRHEVRRAGEEVLLTAREFALLLTLAAHSRCSAERALVRPSAPVERANWNGRAC